MKIAICGAHGVGKTTLASILGSTINLTVLPDVVIDAHNMGFAINEWTSMDAQLWMAAQQLAYEKNNSRFIADKCIFDYYVYAHALDMDTSLQETIKSVALRTHNYDHIFYIKPEFPLPQDGELRSTNQSFQDMVDKHYQFFLQKESIDFSFITGSVDQRVEQVLSIVR